MIWSPTPISSGTAILILGVALAACSSAESVASHEEPVTVAEVAGTELSRITLTESAAERLDIQTTEVESASLERVVPSAAVIIDPQGAYWVYTNEEPFVFVRHELRSVREEGFDVYFDFGPEVGTPVVTIGVPELYGTEFGIGK